jgi:autotransporter-associated beta strand protein
MTKQNNPPHSGRHACVLAAVLVPLIVTAVATVDAADWPCFRGANKDSISSESMTVWPPQRLWTANVGIGYSGVSVWQGKVYAMGVNSSKNQDTISCFDELTISTNPTPLWTYSYPVAYWGQNGYDGTRATPTVDGGQVYTFSLDGQLKCLDRVTGALLWSNNVQNSYNYWGYAGSPLVEGNMVIVNALGHGVAFDKTTHNIVWGTNDVRDCGYSSPFAVTLGGTRTVVIWGGNEISGVDPLTGSVLWDYSWRGYNTMDPIITNNQMIAATVNGDNGCDLINLGARTGQITSASRTWINGAFTPWVNCPVLYNNAIYGIVNSGAGLMCLNFSDGVMKWNRNEFSDKGSVTVVGGNLLALNDNGDLIVIQTVTNAYTEIHRTNLFTGASFMTTPTISNGRMYVKTHEGTLAVYQVGVLGGGANPTGYLQFASSTYSVTENVSSATIEVTRMNGSSGTVSVTCSTANGTATAGSDYVATSGTLTFNPGDTSKTFTVSIINDALAEPDETINLTLSNITGGGSFGSLTNAVLTILDDDRPPVTTLYWDPAGSKTGTGSGGNGNWDTTTSAWYPPSASSDQTWASGKDACFAGAIGTVTVTTPVTAGSITFAQSNYNITGSTITLTNSGIVCVDILPTNLVTINSMLAGSAGMNKTGRGVLSIANTANTYTGPTVVNLGSLFFYNTGKITNSSSLTVNPGASVFMQSAYGNVSGRLGLVPVTLNGGYLRFTGQNSGGSGDTIQSLTIGPGFSDIYFHGENGYMSFSMNDLTASHGAVCAMYQVSGGGDVIVSNAPVQIGGGGSYNSKVSIMPYAVYAVDIQNNALGDFMFYEASSHKLKPTSWSANSYQSSIASSTNTDNVRIGNAQAVNSPTAINSLIFDGCAYSPSSTADITGSGALTICSGGIILLRAPEHFSNPVIFPSGVEGRIYIGNDRATDRSFFQFSPVIRASISGDSGLTITGQPFFPYRVGNAAPFQDMPHIPYFNPDPVILSGSSTYTGDTYINAARIVPISPASFGNSTNIIFNFGATLSASNDNFMSAIQSVTLNPGSAIDAGTFSTTISNLTLNPGYLGLIATNGTLTVAGRLACIANGQPSAAILPMTGNLTMNGSFQAYLGGATPGTGSVYHTQLKIAGNVAIGASATLNIVLGGPAAPGAQYMILSNLGSQGISGTFSGVPESGTVQALYAGTNYSFTVSYTGGDGNDLTLTAAGGQSGPPVVTSPTTASGMVNQPFSYQITATGSPTNYNATVLPTGLNVNRATGLISGTPTVVGTNSVNLSAINSNGTGTATLTITISALVPPTITSATTATGTVGQAFSYQITATGSPTNYTATGLPSGLNLNSSSGLISGTPNAAGTNSVTLNAYGAGGTGTATLTITISLPPAPVITSGTTVNSMVGQPFSYQITASGFPTNFNATGLPSGLGVNRATGLINGTPTTPGTNSVTLSATGVGGTGNATLTITITPVPPGPTGLVGWWKLDESNGTTAADSSGNGNNGALAGGTWQPSGGHFAGAILLGGGALVNCGATTSLNTPSVTVAFWMKADGLETSSAIDKLPQTGSVGYAVKLRADGSMWFRVGAEGGSALDVYGATGIYSAGTWVHVACSFDAATGNMRMYINDVLEAHQPSYAVTLNASSTALLLGSSREPYAGLLDDVRVYDHALSVSEIAAVMANTGGVQPPVISGITPTLGKPQLSWISASGTTYGVYKSTNLLAAWPTQAMTNITGDGTMKTFIDASTIQPEAFYRITAR